MKRLLDIVSNFGLICEDIFHERYPTTLIKILVQVDISGLGKSSAIGFALLPIWFVFVDSNQ